MLVITAHVSQAPNDKREIVPVLDKVQALPGMLGRVQSLTADTGYFSAANVNACAAREIEPLLATMQNQHVIRTTRRPLAGHAGRDLGAQLWRTVRGRILQRRRTVFDQGSLGGRTEFFVGE
jgi:hypothetical protein